MKQVYIYTLTDPVTNEIRYVGKTNDIRTRFSCHLGRNNPKSHKASWIASLKARNLIPIIEIIDIVPIDNWKFWEKYWISQLISWGFNLTNHTEGGDGATFSNIGSFKSKHTPWNKGVKGYSTSKKNQTIPLSVRDKISLTLTGKPSKKKRTVKQYNTNMELIKEFASITEAKNITNIKGIANVVSGRALSAGGYIWQ